MSQHFSFDVQLEAIDLALLGMPWTTNEWHPSLSDLPTQWYNPGRYHELSDYSFEAQLQYSPQKRKRILSLWEEYKQVVIQYEHSVYNALWMNDHQFQTRFQKIQIFKFFRNLPDRFYAYCYRSWIFPWVKTPIKKEIIHAEQLDEASMEFFRNIQEKNSEILTEVVEKLSPLVAVLLSLAVLIYLVKSGILLDSLGLEIVNDVLVRK